jgi:hypothetical protein
MNLNENNIHFTLYFIEYILLSLQFFLFFNTNNQKFTILTIFTTQFSGVKYIHLIL